ncbi:PTPA-CTERM sorting domain-containing protein [Leptolyngbya sp. Heron Island J]|uniref:PTPA-CTERM sorting domain-containing protein n=1 Tax=Leptolyngbya sp. Heron Island J TaxID=1385935 RepID=UPI00137894CB|nr:PTPA-CTERM sorting domain-containing protein [Leptolyngbya sp. Heron Island J]
MTRFPSYSWANGEAVNGLFLSLQQDFGGEIFSVNTGGISGARAQNSAFLSLFGLTLPGGARGWYDQEIVDNSSTMVRVSTNTLIVARFIGIGDSGAARRQSGVFLVKDNTPAEPIPTPALLPGLIGMGVAALRKRIREPQ